MKSIPYCIQEEYNIYLMQLLMEDYLYHNNKKNIYLFLSTKPKFKLHIRTKKWLNYTCSEICKKYDLLELEFNYNKLTLYIKNFQQDYNKDI